MEPGLWLEVITFKLHPGESINLMREKLPFLFPHGNDLICWMNHWAKKWICTNLLPANMSQKCKN